MKSRDIIIFVVALVLAVLVAVVTRTILKPSVESIEAQQRLEKQETEILVPTKSLSVGEVITPQSLSWVKMSQETIIPEYITHEKMKAMGGINQAVVRNRVMKGEPIRDSDIIVKGGANVLSALVSPGMQAVTLPIDRNAPVSGLIAPGDLVDIVVANQQVSKKGGGRQYQGRVIVKKAKVLSVDDQLETPKAGEGKTPKIITVEVQASQAEIIAAALREGRVMFALNSLQSGDAPQKELEIWEEEPEKEHEVIIMRGGKSAKSGAES
jgi:pilus assembly protein CpaB